MQISGQSNFFFHFDIAMLMQFRTILTLLRFLLSIIIIETVMYKYILKTIIVILILPRPLYLTMVLKNQLCSQCEYKTRNKSHLQNHIKSVHEGQKFPCTQCRSIFSQKAGLQTHIKSVHEGQKFTCHQCEFKASQKGHLQRHINLVHEGA